MTHVRTSLAVWLLFAATLAPFGAWAEAYKWVDKDGVIHLTDNPYDLPEPQRSRVLHELEEKRKAEEKKRKKRGSKYGPLPPGSRDHRLPVQALPTDEPVSSFDAGVSEAAEKEPEESAVDTRLTEQTRAFWRKRLDAARKKVGALERRCRQLESDRDRHRRNALIFAKPGSQQSAARAMTELERCREELEQARHQLEVALPEQARRAGVPPGWLRD